MMHIKYTLMQVLHVESKYVFRIHEFERYFNEQPAINKYNESTLQKGEVKGGRHYKLSHFKNGYNITDTADLMAGLKCS